MRAAPADGRTAIVPDVSTTEPPALIRAPARLTAVTAPQKRTSNSRRPSSSGTWANWPRDDAVSSGVHQVIQLADLGERLGHRRLAAGVDDDSAAAAGQRGQGGVEPGLAA